MLSQKVELPDKMADLFEGEARHRVAWGGRASTKSWSYAIVLVLRVVNGARVLCTRELQQSIKDSSHKLIKDTIFRLNLSNQFIITEKTIKHIHGGEFIFKGMRHNTQEIKSTEGVDICWIEEAQKTTKESIDVLIPTIRKAGSELWWSFNPDDEDDAVYQKFIVETPPPKTKIVNINWQDNPWFDEVLDTDRLDMLEKDPDGYDNVWNGKCRNTLIGSYYGEQLKWLKENNRICDVPWRAEFSVSAYFDVGKSDHTAIWWLQKIGPWFNVINYWDMTGGDIPEFAKELLSHEYIYEKIILPHDAAHLRLGMGGKTIKQQFQDLMPKHKFILAPVTPSVQADILAVKTFLKRCQFDDKKTELGRKALKNYKKQWDDKAGKYKDKPLHNWASNGSDAFRELVVHNINEFGVPRPSDEEKTGVPTFNKAMQMSRGGNKRI